jgi:hypothetical protein
MDLVITGILAGVLGTIAMDLLNHLLARTGLILRIDVRMIGRMSAGWFRGRFRYRNPTEMVQVANELLLGYITHYTIGVGLAIPFVFAWSHLFGEPVSPEWILAYGVATTLASVLVVYPSLGLGVFGMRSPEGIRAPLSSLANHFFFGAGMAVSIAVT